MTSGWVQLSLLNLNKPVVASLDRSVVVSQMQRKTEQTDIQSERTKPEISLVRARLLY